MAERVRVGPSTKAIMEGEVDVSQFDDEELRRGRQRDRNGQFRGKPSTVVPRAVYEELRRRTVTEFYEMVRQELMPSMEVVVAMAKGEIPADPTRLKAAENIVNRFVGKVPETVNLNAIEKKPWEDAIEAGITYDVQRDEDVIDAKADDEPWDV